MYILNYFALHSVLLVSFGAKYFAVIAVIIAIFIGIVVFMVLLDKRIREFEKKIENGGD